MEKNIPFHFQRFKNGLAEIYGLGSDENKGRLITLVSGMIVSVYNVFITGIFYTGFLSMYGISITGVGIVSFIPFIASCFSLFSPKILGRFKKRKWLLLGAKIYFYGMYILATNLMPQLVKDPDARLVWFVVILFLAYSVYALFSPGITSWFSRFYPMNNERRTHYIVSNQIFSAVVSALTLLLTSILMDQAAGTPRENRLIMSMRYIAFGLVLLDVAVQACAKEYPHLDAPGIRLIDIFVLPTRYRKFLLCMLFMFAWSFNGNLNAGTWTYHTLNHLNYSYTLINVGTMSYTVILLLTSKMWERVLGRLSWIRTFGLACVFLCPLEVFYFFLQPGTEIMYLLVVLVQNVLSVALNISYANVLYMNLPEENATAHVTFNTIGCNLFAFLGTMAGTWLSSLSGDSPWDIMGMQFYSVQITCIFKFVFYGCMGYILLRYWRAFTRDEDVAQLEARDAQRCRRKKAAC